MLVWQSWSSENYRDARWFNVESNHFHEFEVVCCLFGWLFFSKNSSATEDFFFFENNSRTIHTECLRITLTLLFHHLKSLENFH